MTYSLHPGAAADLREAAAYYRERAGNGLALAFLNEFEHSVGMLLQHPLLGALGRNGKRRLVMPRFPYAIVYHLNNHNQQIQVLAVAHQSRRPGYWATRK